MQADIRRLFSFFFLPERTIAEIAGLEAQVRGLQAAAAAAAAAARSGDGEGGDGKEAGKSGGSWWPWK